MITNPVSSIAEQLEDVLAYVESEKEKAPDILAVDKRLSAKNLRNYMKFRELDIAEFQAGLGSLGLSRFARAEGHILHSIYQVRSILRKLNNEELITEFKEQHPDPDEALQLLTHNTYRLLGPRMPERRMMIMATLPSESAEDAGIIEKLVAGGMNCARINCAHDNPETWLKMIDHVRTAAAHHDRTVKIAMDLGGPKLRTTGVSGTLLDKKGNKCLLLFPEDKLLLTANLPANEEGDKAVSMSLPSILQDIKPGERIFFDDGKIECVVREKQSDQVELCVIRCKPQGSRLRIDKGINFPDSELSISGLTEQDKIDLRFIVKHADIVNFSFVNTIEDLKELFHQMPVNQTKLPGVILKIETKRAYNNLSSLLLESMRYPNPAGVMIARGDLAVEAGWENIGYIQREILRICTAAHTPIVWATQVLENLAKKGTPSRSEVTDIVQSMKADCVMLNKGPFVNDALVFLNNFLIRGEEFQQKNKSMLPSLRELI